MKLWLSSLLFSFFRWVGLKFFFNVAVVYSQSGYIKSIYFSVNEYHLNNGMKGFLEDEQEKAETDEAAKSL